MISVKQLAEYFENGLNKTLGNPEIQFKIWADAGEYKKPERDGNVITNYILGNLRTSTSANDATDLVMGVNGLSLDFKIPVQAPKTNATQTAAELQKIQDGQYPYLAYITNALNGYFQKAWADTLYDGSGAKYSVAFQAGTAVTGNAEIAARYGLSVDFNVYIEVYFIQDGINSKDVKIYFDGESVPYQALRFGRSPMLESEVYAGSLVSKNIATSTAFSIDVDFPANNVDLLSREVIDYLLNGKINSVHFVELQWGDEEKLYLLSCNTMQTSSQGIAISGVSVSLMETVENLDALDVPDGFQIGKFTFVDSGATTLTFMPSVDCLAYIADNVLRLKNGIEVSLQLGTKDIRYDGEKYYAVLITSKAFNPQNPSAPFSVIKG